MKRALLLTMLLIFISRLEAQTFQRAFFSGGARFLSAGPFSAKTNDGGTISAYLWYSKSNSFVLQLVKISADGTPSYLSNIALAVGTYVTTIVQCADGGYAIVGGDGSYPGGILIYKTNANGNLVWSNRYTKLNNITYSYDAIASGNYILISGQGEFPNGSNIILMAVNATSGDIFTYQKYSNTDSLPFWQTQLIKPSAGGFAICSQVGFDALLFKVNTNKKIAWAKKISLGNYSVKVRTMITTADGGFVIGGSLYEAGNFEYNGVVAIKLNSTGNVVWAKELSFSNEELISQNGVYAIIENADSSLVMAGEYYSDRNTNRFITKTNKNGDVIRSFIDDNYITINNIFKAANDHFLIAGINYSLFPRSVPFFTNFNANGTTCNSNQNVTCTIIDHAAAQTAYNLKAADITANITQSQYAVSTMAFGHVDSLVCNSAAIVKASGDKIFTASIKPNIVSNNLLNLQIKSSITTDAKIVIKGVGNNILYQSNCNLVNGVTTKNINLPTSIPGFYFVQIIAGNQQQLLKFYKQ